VKKDWLVRRSNRGKPAEARKKALIPNKSGWSKKGENLPVRSLGIRIWGPRGDWGRLLERTGLAIKSGGIRVQVRSERKPSPTFTLRENRRRGKRSAVKRKRKKSGGLSTFPSEDGLFAALSRKPQKRVFKREKKKASCGRNR